MHTSMTTEEQLRKARIRIAALEKELETLRSTTEPTSAETDQFKASSPIGPNVSNEGISHGNGGKTCAAYSEVSRDQSQLSVSCLEVRANTPLLELTQSSLASTSPSTSGSPLLSDRPVSLGCSIAAPLPATIGSHVPMSCPPDSLVAPTPVAHEKKAPACPSQTPLSKQPPSRTAALPQSDGRVDAVKGNSPKRRPVPLPVSKTTTTKKDRSALVAKCPEPRPGQTRYWTDEEHERFLEAIAEYGEKAYVAISNYVETRTPKQVRTHAQKFQMKMARLARQSLEAGQPIRMPPGMCPVIEVPIGSKSTIVPITPEQSARLCAPSPSGDVVLDPTTVVSTLSSSLHSSKRRGGSSSKETVSPAADKMTKVSSGKKHQVQKNTDSTGSAQQPRGATVSPKAAREEGSSKDRRKESSHGSSSSRTDACLEYIGCSVVPKDEMELETSFAEELNETLQSSVVIEDETQQHGDFLMSERSMSDSGSSGEDDDLEDLEKLEDDLSLAPFAHASESWLLPDATPTSP